MSGVNDLNQNENKQEKNKMAIEMSENELDMVNGGTVTELHEILEAAGEAGGYKTLAKIANFASGNQAVLVGQAYGVESLLKDIGIDANVSVGFHGIGSKANIYVDSKTGKRISHSDLINSLKTGAKTWA